MALSDFRCIMRFRIPFCDINMAQHAGNTAYVVWAETIRGAYFDEVLKEPLSVATGMILARQEFSYTLPLSYREEVAIACRVSRIGRKSFDFAYEIWSETKSQLAAHALSTQVAYDYEMKSSILVPEHWRKLMSEYEVLAPTAE